MSKLAVLQVGSFAALLDPESAGLIDADIQVARDHAAAIAAAAVLPPDVILVGDFPDVDALESCRALKRHPSLSRVPIILVTTPHTTGELRRAALDSGVEAFVQQSADICELAAMVRSLSRLQRALSAEPATPLREWPSDADDEIHAQLFKRTTDAMLVVDGVTGRVTRANTVASTLYGYTSSEFRELRETDLCAGPNLAADNGEEKATGPQRKRQRRKDGSTFAAEVTVTTIQAQGRPARFLHVRDVSGETAMQEALVQSRNLMRYVIEHAPGSIGVMDRELKHIYLSQRFLNEYGITEQDAIGRHHYDVFPDLPARYKEAHVRALCGEIIRSAEDCWLRADGTTQWGYWECRPWYEGDGSIGGIVIYTELTTEQKLAEKALRENEERLKYALEGAGDGAWERNAETDEVYLAPRWKEILGYRPWEVTNKFTEWESRIHPDDRAHVFEKLNLHLSGKTPNYQSEHRLRCKDGIYKWVLDRGKVITRTIDGKPMRMFGTHVDITQRKQLEEERKIRQEQLESIFNHIPVMLGFIDAQGQMQIGNPALEQTLGWTSDEYRRHGFLQLCYPDPQVAKSVGDWLSNVEKSWHDFKTRTKDGRVLDTSWINVALSDGRVICIGQDVTNRKQAERELSESRKRFEDIIFSMGDWVWETDEHGVYTYSSSKGVDLFGSARGEIIGKNPFDFMAPDEAARVGVLFANLVSRQAPIRDLENWNIAENGELICLLTNGVPILDEAGNLKGYRGVDKDITARKRAELERARLMTAFDQAQESIVITDDSTKILYANPATERISGYPRDELIGRTAESFPLSEEDFAFYRKVGATLSTGQVWRGRRNARRKDGTSYLEDITFSPVRDSSGRVVNTIAVSLDVTREAELQAQLAQAQKMESIGRLAGGVAHDFNNLLTVINGYSRMILGELHPSDPLRPRMEQIQRAGERASALTRQLLAFSRKQVLQPRVFDLNDVIGGIQPMLERLVGNHLRVHFELSPDLAMVNADPHQVEQVIMNLAINARDAMPDGGDLVFETSIVEASRPGAEPDANRTRYCLLAVRDTGIGIDLAILDRIFDPFFTTKAPGEGTGLGLSMVQGIVAQSGGFVEVGSRPRAGTTFRVYLPAVESEIAAIPARVTGSAALRGTETILLVEDQPEVLAFTSAVMSSYGYEVLAAGSGEDALAMFKSEGERVQLLLTDVVMPYMGGAELASRITALRPGISILFMSGHTNDMPLPIDSKHTDFIQKPFAPQDLAAAIRELLGKRAARSAHILVADDEPGVRSFLRTVLEQAHYQVGEAADGKQALNYTSTHAVDLVITDLVMPEKEGLETIQSLRRSKPNLAIIAISGAFGGQFLQTAQLLGADEVLAKPVSVDTLLSAVARQLSTSKDANRTRL